MRAFIRTKTIQLKQKKSYHCSDSPDDKRIVLGKFIFKNHPTTCTISSIFALAFIYLRVSVEVLQEQILRKIKLIELGITNFQ